MKILTTFLCSICTLVGFSQNHPVVSCHILEYRMVRVSTNFLVDDILGPALEVITAAAENCYNGVVVSDVKFGFLAEYIGTDYFENLHTFLDSAKVLGLQVYPETIPFGYSSPILFHNPNLAAGLPVVNAPFVVDNVGGGPILVNAPSDVFPIANTNFETVPTTANVFPGWSWQDGAGEITFWDNTTSHSGVASARVSNPGSSDNGNARIVQSVNVETYRDYHVSFWIKTENFDPAFVNVLVLNLENSRLHQHNPVSVSVNQDWTKYDLTFNTLDAQSLSIYFGVWNGGNGDLWWDDITIEPTTFNNILRREGTPVTLFNNGNGETLSEDIDVNPIVDPMMGNDPWPGSFSIWHDQPVISIPSGSSLSEGDEVLVSYFHAAIVNGGQVTAALTEPEVFDITTTQLTEIRDEFLTADLFDGWFFQYDEIRAHNWDESPSYGSPGEDLAFNFNTVYQQARELDDNAKIMVWSDMFDPFHNAYDMGDPYYLVNELWDGSWEGVPDDVIIFNWNGAGDRISSGQFFSDQGHQQVLAGYYDEADNYTVDWLADLNGVEGIKGVMYTTWVPDFDDLGDWAETVWGACGFVSTTDQTKYDKVELFPNPATTYCDLNLARDQQFLKGHLYNAIGEMVLTTNDTHLELAHLPRGFYTLVAQTNKGTFNTKLLLF